MKHGMMNLTIGEYYYVVGGCNIKRRGKISAKTVHSKDCHTYLISWPHETGINPYGIYIWDYGYAKLLKPGENLGGYYWSRTSWSRSYVVAYRKLTKIEREPMEIWFKEKEERARAWLDEVNERARIQAAGLQAKYEGIMRS